MISRLKLAYKETNISKSIHIFLLCPNYYNYEASSQHIDYVELNTDYYKIQNISSTA